MTSKGRPAARLREEVTGLWAAGRGAGGPEGPGTHHVEASRTFRGSVFFRGGRGEGRGGRVTRLAPVVYETWAVETSKGQSISRSIAVVLDSFLFFSSWWIWVVGRKAFGSTDLLGLWKTDQTFVSSLFFPVPWLATFLFYFPFLLLSWRHSR